MCMNDIELLWISLDVTRILILRYSSLSVSVQPIFRSFFFFTLVFCKQIGFQCFCLSCQCFLLNNQYTKSVAPRLHSVKARKIIIVSISEMCNVSQMKKRLALLIYFIFHHYNTNVKDHNHHIVMLVCRYFLDFPSMPLARSPKPIVSYFRHKSLKKICKYVVFMSTKS